MPLQSFFVTGTDTDVGKTFISCALLAKAEALGLKTIAMKPVAAGCQSKDGYLQNEDALSLAQVITEDIPYQQLNPVALEPAIAPHIAAVEAGKSLTIARIAGICRGVLMRKHDFGLIEGAGGWRVPLNHRETLADLAKQLRLPVILVVGMRLGCINHALLTAEAIRNDGLNLAGWVANSCGEKMDRYHENIETLKTLLPAPLLGEVPFLSDQSARRAAEYLKLPL